MEQRDIRKYELEFRVKEQGVKNEQLINEFEMQFNMIMDFSQGTQSRFPNWTMCGFEGNGKGYNATYCHWKNEGLSEQ